MSQCNVEQVVGRILTDEAFRRRFALDPVAALHELIERGVALTSLEVHALTSIDPNRAARFADTIDPRIQKCDLHRDCS